MNSVVHEDLTGDRAGVRVISIRRPRARNALDLATKDLLVQSLSAADEDPAVRAIVLTGDDGIFVAGTDLKEMGTFRPTDHLVRRTGQVFSVLDALGTPVVAAVEGYALGGGCELAMACDVVVAGASARFGQPEIRVGLIPGAGGLSRLVQRAGRSRALRLVLTGDHIDAETARDLGIVADIVPDGTALEAASALAARIARQPPLNVEAVRKVARHAENSPLHTAIELERTTFQLLFDTADHDEGIEAFLGKRTPNYEGR
ncbi:enoyl-CoA hydratase/carnithine racemase [Nocardia transvalensis]|uniref:Probable enoyl-CoA hydratase EchA17 n=1 Tax=Nocardia transvalensis TaxID=37333 RepID=A0A7W9UM37_9NOCA|nr:enoyl-CoA hydratase-related protein [Nocardia transvalensis]MBB5918226.1 enoyl-CoA hydratase/carnithine racemase [Nocardia transvalensis]